MAEEENIQPEEFSLHERLRSLGTTDFYDLVSNLLVKKPELYQLILEWFKEKQESMPEIVTGDDVVSINDNLLFEYWEDARSIISEFNELGGGPEDKEDEAYRYLDQISKLIKEGSISTDAKLDFLDEAFEEYNINNSGFEDGLMEIFFEICQTKEEWEYLIKKLDEHPSNWRKGLIMQIQKEHLHDDEAYMQERMQILSSGMDYWDLVQFYLEKGNQEKALETAEEGILKGEGNCSWLFEYLSDHFSKKRDAVNLERIVNTALARNTEKKNMLDKLFDYYKSEGDYEKAKGALLKSLEFVMSHEYYKEYKRLKGFLKEPDWKAIEPEILSRAREKNFYNYLQICLDKGMKEEVLEEIMNVEPPGSMYSFSDGYRCDEFADKLTPDFPEKIIEYYWQKSLNKIPRGGRGTYSTVAEYLEKIKSIYIDILNDEERWIKRFNALKTEFKKRPAFLDEVKHL